MTWRKYGTSGHSGATPFYGRPRRLAIAIDCCLPQAARHSPRNQHMWVGYGATLGFACGVFSSAMATTYTVDTPFDPGPVGTTSLREAIFQANGSPNNIVEFASILNGSTVTLQGGEIAVTSPMYIIGPGADKLTISASHLSRIFDIEPPSGTIAVTISGVTLAGGYTVDPLGGGAVIAVRTQLTLQHSHLSGNQANSGGGGLRCGAATCLLNDVTMEANAAPNGGGGGFYSTNGSASVVASVISGNSAKTGGGIKVLGSGLTLTDTLIRGNTSTFSGGGIYCFTDALSLNRVSVSGNSAGNYPNAVGGGIYFVGKNLTVTRSLISGNSANSIYNDGGGGIAVNGSVTAMYVDSSTMYGNYAVGDAGGILVMGGKLRVSSSTIAGNNTGGYSPGNAIKAAGSDNLLSGTIVANNFNRGGTSDLEGNFTVDYCLVKTPGAGVLTLEGLGNILNGTDPQLGPLAENGGPTMTMLPAAGSEAINHNDPAISSGTDQRNLPRVVNGRADIGSVERQYPEDVIFRSGFDSS